MLDQALSVLENGWTAFSFWSALAGAGGLGAIAAAVLAGLYLPLIPAFLRHTVLAVGVALLVGAGLYQAGMQKGARDAFARDAVRALAAETARADAAVAIAARDRERTARDLASANADLAALKEITDALAKDSDRGRTCLDRDTARRLRSL